ncbi:M23 family metallopeptidase [Gulbenkiania mobilis]|uniref:Murein DD-endopeptidase MepM/ murein hydrolase activator NlpD n=1 Tax=Gulbenkiania mobilis TaxID=397457 RepID=A0ABY2CVU3_GULMO|nr:murein DD-endopeptidase MepM/ murein hydrolase activator NlpD [Gulbenkiania mobilis]
MDYRKLLKIPQNGLGSLVNHQLGWFAVAASLPAFGMLTAFAVAPGSQMPEPAPAVQEITQRLALPDFKLNSSPTRYWREEPVARGETLSQLLHRLGIRDRDVASVLSTPSLSRNLLRLKAGATLSVQTNDQGELFAVRFLNDDENGEKVLVALEKAGERWQASAQAPETEATQTVRAVDVTSSLTGALARNDVPVEIRAQLAEIFSDQIDLNTLGRGDRVSLVYETLNYQGTPIATGNILAAEVEKAGQVYQAYYFAHGSEAGAYYDALGRPMKKGFSQQPVSDAPISSGFGLRYHPVLHALRMHEGIDYAAKIGAPVVAPSDGTVELAETQNGYGNVIELRHGSKLSTLYGHLSAFAPGLRPGKAVKAGEVIGYVGNTGRSTGPHLHFEVKVAGQPVDPATTALPTPGLTASERIAFRNDSLKLAGSLRLLRDIPVNVAQLD